MAVDSLLLLTAAAHIFYTPFTKVEESFNLQAMHDILYLRHNFSQYDHHEFPGVVPRTFVGPLVISILSSPFIILFEAFRIHKFWAQYVVRLMLAAVISVAWHNLRHVITKIYNVNVRIWFTLITLTQFHFIFYMSRPLPNVMVLPLVLYALAYWLQGRLRPFLICSGIAILVFRSELIIFFGLLLLCDLLMRKTTIDSVLKIALPVGLAILVTTIIVDSFFWQRLLWPEGEVLWYNTILNKSSNWGLFQKTSPFLWYFYSAIPRAMGVSLLFVPFGLYFESRVRRIVLAAIGFVFIYSILPHKELRFIIYIFPVLNLAAACACHRFWINRAKSMWHGILAFCAGGHLLLNVLITIFLLIISGTNYPGGVALTRLHRLESNTPNVSVHISNLAAQSGVSRFMQFRNDWRYCKDEHLNYTQAETEKYSHLLVETKNKQNTQLWTTLQEDFETIEFVDCFSSIGLQYSSPLPVRIKTKPCIGILKKRPNTVNNISEPLARNGDGDADDDDNNADKLEIKDKKATKSNSFKTLKLEESKKLLSSNLEETSKDINQNTDGGENNYETDDDLNDGIVEKDYSDSREEDVNDITIAKLDSIENMTITVQDASDQPTKEINFQELRNLALGHVTHKTKATKRKIRQIIEQHYRSKGKQIEEHEDTADMGSSEEKQENDLRKKVSKSKPTVRSIIKQEQIKEMIEQIATMDLTRICDLENVTTKDCLKQVIDKIDDESGGKNLI